MSSSSAVYSRKLGEFKKTYFNPFAEGSIQSMQECSTLLDSTLGRILTDMEQVDIDPRYIKLREDLTVAIAQAQTYLDSLIHDGIITEIAMYQVICCEIVRCATMIDRYSYPKNTSIIMQYRTLEDCFLQTTKQVHELIANTKAIYMQ